MRKIILSVAVSLDGFIEGPNGEYDWCPPPSKNEMESFLDGIDSIFMGRKSFEMAGASMFPGKACYVFSNSLKKVKGKNTELVSGNVIEAVQAIKQQQKKNIWLFGGASLTTTFMNHHLVDEMWLGIVPVVLGQGKALFQNIQQRQHFTVMESAVSKGYLSLKLSRGKK